MGHGERGWRERLRGLTTVNCPVRSEDVGCRLEIGFNFVGVQWIRYETGVLEAIADGSITWRRDGSTIAEERSWDSVREIRRI